MNEIIKGCPFCGCLSVNINRTNKNACWVSCVECEANTDSAKTRKGAIAKWNLRRGDAFATVVEDDDKEFKQRRTPC